MSDIAWRQWIRTNVRAANPLLWVLEGKLACAPRPLRYDPRFGGRVHALPPDAAGALTDWLRTIRDAGIGTITCLATPAELKRYAAVVESYSDLLALYRSKDFVVHHHPIEDPAHAPAEDRAGILGAIDRIKTIVLGEYHQRTGGLLLHCSGGMDRTAPIAAFIAAQEAGLCPYA